jgi:hypothetical protein
MPDVMEQAGDGDRSRIVFGQAEESGHLRPEMIDTEGVLEPCVLRAGIDKICHAELFDVAQPLEQGVVDDPDRVMVKRDMVVDRASYSLHGGPRGGERTFIVLERLLIGPSMFYFNLAFCELFYTKFLLPRP